MFVFDLQEKCSSERVLLGVTYLWCPSSLRTDKLLVRWPVPTVLGELRRWGLSFREMQTKRGGQRAEAPREPPRGPYKWVLHAGAQLPGKPNALKPPCRPVTLGLSGTQRTLFLRPRPPSLATHPPMCRPHMEAAGSEATVNSAIPGKIPSFWNPWASASSVRKEICVQSASRLHPKAQDACSYEAF